MASKKQQQQMDILDNLEQTQKILENTERIAQNTSLDENNGQLNVENLFGEMLNVENENAQQKIVSEIVNDDNLELKTEISKVSELTILTVYQEYLEENKLHKSSETLKRYRDTLFRYSISKNRKSRDELIRMVEALSPAMQQTENNSKVNLIS